MKSTYISIFLVIGLIACGGSENKRINELNKNRNKWESYAITDYQVITRQLCFCLNTEAVVVIVKDREIDSAFYEVSGEYLTEEEMRYARTIETHFALARDAILNADYSEVEYDPVYGFPTRIYADRYDDSVDDEITYYLRDFQ